MTMAGCLLMLFILLGVFINLKWLIVALMLILIVIPGIAAWIYFDYGLRRSVAFNAIAHSIEITDAGIKIVPFVNLDNTDRNETPAPPAPLFFSKDIIGEPGFSVDGIFIPLLTKPSGFVWLPSEFKTENEADSSQPAEADPFDISAFLHQLKTLN